MVKEDGYSLESIYGGGYSSLDSTYGNLFTGYRMSAGEIGAPTKPDTANQIQAIGSLLNQGIIPVEIQVLSPEVFDQIPKQHFKEIKQEAKLAGSELSMHAPLIEPSGITDRGWSEADRELAERQLSDVVEKSMDLTDKGGMTITIHA